MTSSADVPELGRRRLIKGAAAGAAAAAVWAEPTINGLARRPAYAATVSGAVCAVFLANTPYVLAATVNGVVIDDISPEPARVLLVTSGALTCTFDTGDIEIEVRRGTDAIGTVTTIAGSSITTPNTGFNGTISVMIPTADVSVTCV